MDENNQFLNLFDYRSNKAGTDFVGFTERVQNKKMLPSARCEGKLHCSKARRMKTRKCWLDCFKTSVYDLDFPDLVKLLPHNRPDVGNLMLLVKH